MTVEWKLHGRADHWLDCELENLAFAMMRKLLPWSADRPKEKEKEPANG
jgi:hypothetical protein